MAAVGDLRRPEEALSGKQFAFHGTLTPKAFASGQRPLQSKSSAEVRRGTTRPSLITFTPTTGVTTLALTKGGNSIYGKEKSEEA